jgi:hypothetical protein
MLDHERFRPPSRDYPADVWNVIEKGLKQLVILAVSRA